MSLDIITHHYRSQSTPDDLRSQSPVSLRSTDSRSSRAAPPQSETLLQPIRSAEESGHPKESQPRAKKSSSSSSDKHKSKIKSKSSGRHRDPTGGSAKLKVNELTS